MLGMIWAQGHGGAIGRAGQMAWHLPEDMAFFRKMTMGHPVIMGRKTWESLEERFRPLPGRMNVVVTRDPDFSAEGALVASSLEEAVQLAEEKAREVASTGGDTAGTAGAEGADNSADDPLVWIMGGAQIYEAGMALAGGVVVTDIDIDVPDADAFAPKIPFNWETIDTDPYRGWHTAKDGTRYRITTYRRRRSRFNPGPLNDEVKAREL